MENKALLGLLIWGVLLTVVSASLLERHHHSHHNKEKAKECGKCEPESCPSPRGCLAGLVLDHCKCCMVCGRKEGEKCDNPELPLHYTYKYGFCGEHLECKLRDDLMPEDSAEALCFCKNKNVVCGTDNKTYANTCQFQEEAYRTRNGMKIASRGPCRDVPWIVTGPEEANSEEGSNVALSCEAMGYPIPSIEWRMTRPDGTVIALPRDDQHIAAQLRGGPEQYEITGWLQILSLKPDDEGTYHCVAKNAVGEILSSAKVSVILKLTGEDSSAEKEKGETKDEETADDNVDSYENQL